MDCLVVVMLQGQPCVPHEGATEGHMSLALLGTTLLHPSKMVNSVPPIMHVYFQSFALEDSITF